jgi:protein SCO1
VDPERDTLEHLSHYVGYFDDAFLGVTGEHEALRRLTRQLGVLYHHNEPNTRGDYLVDHSAGVFLLDPEGRMVGFFRAPHEANDIAARLRGIRDFVARG